MTQEQRVLLNVGGGKDIAIPKHYQGWLQRTLDIDPRTEPDILSDARDLSQLEHESIDAVYCSHNLEHYFHHDVPKVLSGFLHVLKPDGFAQIHVPDIGRLMRIVVDGGLDIEDVLYESDMGPITVRDVLYGYAPEIESSGTDYYAHKTGFTTKSLPAVLHASGFHTVLCAEGELEVVAFAFKSAITDFHRMLLGIQSNPPQV